MQIQVKCECGASDCREWALLEMQGVLEIQPSAQHLPLHTLSIGSLCRSQQQDKYYLTIGYHELEGKKVALKKPLLVLRKIVKEEPMEVEPSPAILGTQYPKQVQKHAELNVIGVIRHKLLFKTRPKALISSRVPQFSIDFLFDPFKIFIYFKLFIYFCRARKQGEEVIMCHAIIAVVKSFVYIGGKNQQ